jgi:hypothetical protein
MNVEQKAQRREEAESRNSKWAAKSYTEQLTYLDKLFGKGKGAGKQRAKIALAMLKSPAKTTKATKKK